MLQTRSSGILLPLSSLPTPYGIGDMGPAAYDWIDRLVASGQRYWQMLPLHPVHADLQYSPYSGLSAFAGSLLYLSPDKLESDGWISAPEGGEPADEVDYAGAERRKQGWVDEAFALFQRTGLQEEAFQNFCRREAWWLEPYAAFRVGMREHGHPDWTRWPRDWRQYQSVLERLQQNKTTALALERERFGQYLFFRQWYELRSYANRQGLHLIGDIPIYVHHYSADVWAHPELFQLKKNGRAKRVAGVPPDYFSEDGQLWGNPVYDWPVHEAEDFSWWISRIRHELHMYDLLRIDHFLGLIQYWEVKGGAETARKGRYRKAPKEAFFAALQRHFPTMPLLAEDLGSVTDEAVLAMDRYGLPGMKVLHFAFGDEQSGDNPYLPHNWPENCVAYTGTHDNNTTAGWWKEASKAEKRHARAYTGHKLGSREVAPQFLQLLWQSPARLVIAPYQDLLSLDGRARINKPGTTEGNWNWQLQPAQLEGRQWKQLRQWTLLYGRS